MVLGFSTGSLALSRFRRGLQMVAGTATKAIELSALRELELVPLVSSIDSLDLSQFTYISLHAPSRLDELSEAEIVEILEPVANRGWPIVVHPDVIKDFETWQKLGSCLCIENMDKRKAIGRTVAELTGFFERLPLARFCFDIGHARQVDPTMCEADSMLRCLSNRLQQVHLSLVNSKSVHLRLNYESVLAYRRVSGLIPREVPIILETPVNQTEISHELELANDLFS